MVMSNCHYTETFLPFVFIVQERGRSTEAQPLAKVMLTTSPVARNPSGILLELLIPLPPPFPFPSFPPCSLPPHTSHGGLVGSCSGVAVLPS